MGGSHSLLSVSCVAMDVEIEQTLFEQGNNEFNENKQRDLLSVLLDRVLTVVNSSKQDVYRLKGMLKIFRDTVHSDKRFSQSERTILADSIHRNLANIKEHLGKAQKDLHEAERVWSEKQDLMRSWHQAGYLDETVALQWTKTQQLYQRQLERLDAFLQGITKLEL